MPTDSADVAKLVMTSQSECQLFMQAKDLSASTSKDRHAWSETSYDTLDRPMKVTTPRDVWHTAGKAKTTKYISKAANSVRLYHAPRDRIFMQDPNLRKEGLHRFFVYDRAGRMVIQGVSGMCTRGPAVNFADYMTHELYGHGYFYELNLKGYDVNPFHDYRSVMVEGDLMPDCSIPDCVSIRVDFNTKLDNQINIVTSIGKRNYNSRFR